MNGAGIKRMEQSNIIILNTKCQCQAEQNNPVKYFVKSRLRKGGKKKLAFTLAEVLITLGIIGVVAAMTMPNLISSYNAKKLRTQFLKSYSLVTQMFKQYSDDGNTNTVCRETYKQFINYSSNATDCGYDGSKCYKEDVSKKYKTINNQTFSLSRLNDGMILLPGGELLMFEDGNAAIGIILISVDINGYKNPPNKAGYDLFTFQYIDGEVYPMGDRKTYYVGKDYCDINKNDKEVGGISCALYAKDDSEYFKKAVKNLK